MILVFQLLMSVMAPLLPQIVRREHPASIVSCVHDDEFARRFAGYCNLVRKPDPRR